MAGRIGDGYITTTPDAETLAAFRAAGGAGKPTQAGYKVCWGTDDDTAVATAHRLWANSGLPGELAQVLAEPEALRAGQRAGHRTDDPRLDRLRR